MSTWMSAASELFRELFIGGFMAGAVHLFVNQFQGRARHAGEAVGASITQAAEKSREEHRAELFNFLRDRLSAVDPDAAEQIETFIEARRHAPYSAGASNIAIAVLVDLYMHLDEPEEEQDRIEVFRTLGNGTQQQFDQAVDFLNNDIAWQWFLTLLNTLREGGRWTKDRITDLAKWATQPENIQFILDRRDDVAQVFAATLNTTRQTLDGLGLLGEPHRSPLRRVLNVFGL